MKQGRIFLVASGEATLTPMDETDYAKEDMLQELLAAYPDLLPGDQIAPEAPRRWLLVAREMGVPDFRNIGDRWSLDHLFLDQDGIPTFVECKRAADPRIRREVVAQMLEYAANGLLYWNVDRLRETAQQTALRRGTTLEDDLKLLLSESVDIDPDSFWQRVESNLRVGKVRLLFVADSIPAELRRLVEFLNEKMDDVEVLAIEVKQFLGSNAQQVIVPRVIGLTEAAREKKPVAAAKTNREAFLSACPPPVAAIFAQVLDYAVSRNFLVYWGKVGFSIRPAIDNTLTSLLYGWPPASPPTRLEFYTAYLKLDEAGLQRLRNEVASLGSFVQGGAHTYKAVLNPETAQRVLEALPTLFALVDRLVAGEYGAID